MKMDRGNRQNVPPQAIPISLRPSGNRRQARVTAGPECRSGQWCAQEGPGRSRRSERVREAGQSKRLPEHTQEVIENQGNEGGSDFSARPGRHSELLDRKSTRLNSSHVAISYAVFCLKKKNKIQARKTDN